MKKAIFFLILIVILILSIAQNQSPALNQPTVQASSISPPAKLEFSQNTPEQVLDSFYAALLMKDYSLAMAPLFFPRENYSSMVTEAFYAKVKDYKERPIYVQHVVNSPDYALYTIRYSLEFQGINEPVPFLDVLPLIKKDGQWYIFIDNPTSTPLEQAVTDLSADPTFAQAEADYKVQLESLLTQYPELSEALF